MEVVHTTGDRALDEEINRILARLKATELGISTAMRSTVAVAAAVQAAPAPVPTPPGPTCCDEVLLARDSSIYGLFASLDARLEHIESILAGGIGGTASYDFSVDTNSMYVPMVF